MRCPDINEMASYLDATLSGEAMCAMQEHFRNCRMCATALEELRELLGLTPQDPGVCLTASMKSLSEMSPISRRKRERNERIEHCVSLAAH